MSKIKKLTKAQEKLLHKFHDEWLKVGLNTEPASVMGESVKPGEREQR